jgi:transcriptional antiterminator RfaH
MKRWYAVYAQPRSEEIASQHLERQGFQVFLPRYLKRRSHARRVEVAPSPLFPRYLFTAFDAAEPGWRVISSTRGVVSLVRSGGGGLAVVPDAVIKEIEHRYNSDGFVVLARHMGLKQGARIRVDTGAFEACDAIFETQRDDERVFVLLSLLGREVLANIPIGAVVPG